MILLYTFVKHVASVEHRTEVEHVSGTRDANDMAKAVVTRTKSLGWWIVTDGPSPISFCIGDARPDGVIAGMEIKGSFEISVP